MRLSQRNQLYYLYCAVLCVPFSSNDNRSFISSRKSFIWLFFDICSLEELVIENVKLPMSFCCDQVA